MQYSLTHSDGLKSWKRYRTFEQKRIRLADRNAWFRRRKSFTMNQRSRLRKSSPQAELVADMPRYFDAINGSLEVSKSQTFNVH